MSISTRISEDGKEVVITINGRFDYDLHSEFREALEASKQGVHPRYTVDLGGVEDMDSSALGMLLLLRDTAGGDKAQIDLIRCRPDIKDTLLMANFQNLFRIA